MAEENLKWGHHEGALVGHIINLATKKLIKVLVYIITTEKTKSLFHTVTNFPLRPPTKVGFSRRNVHVPVIETAPYHKNLVVSKPSASKKPTNLVTNGLENSLEKVDFQLNL